MKTGKYPGVCPDCQSTNVVMGGGYTTHHPTGSCQVPEKHRDGIHTLSCRAPRLGDPGTERSPTQSECKACGCKWTWTPPEKKDG